MALLEREQHEAALADWLREAAAGQGRLGFVGGEAGVGKTALIDQFRQVASGRARVLRGACDALSTPHPLGPLHDIAAEVGGDLARVLQQAASRTQVFHAALTEFGAGLTPTLVIIEDAHWADEATFDLLRFLGRRLAPLRALVLVTYRNDEVGPGHPLRLVLGDLATTGVVRRLDLASLSIAGMRTLAAGSGLDPAALHRLTGGNPFFASEILADPAGAAGGIPTTVREVVVARVSRLAPEGRAALEAAAVIGSPIAPHLLIEVGETTAAAIDACLAGGLLVPDAHGYAFRHELARTAIYDAIAPTRRRDLHAAVLAALRAAPAGEQDVTRLAHHAEGAGDRQAVLSYAPAAARHAAALGAQREASAQYARALRFATGLPAVERLALLEAYADVSDLAGFGGAAIPIREEMIALTRQAGDRRKEAEHFGWLADTLAIAARYTKAEQAADAAVACLAGLPEDAAHAWAYGHRAHVQLTGGNPHAAIAWGERAVALATRLDDTRARLFGLLVVGEARLLSGDETRGRDDLEQCGACARQAGLDGLVAATLANLGSAHAEIHQFARAERYLSDAIAFATEREDDNWLRPSVVWLAQTRLMRGDWSSAADLAASVLRLPAAPVPASTPPDPRSGTLPLGIPAFVRMRALVTLGRIRARRGDPEAEALFAEALALVGSEAIFRDLAPIRAARAETAWLAGDPTRAAAEAQAALDQPTGHQQAWLAGELALWRWRAGEAIAPPPGLPPPFALEMAGEWAAAAAAWDALGCPYEAALALLDGDEPALRDALASFDRLGAAPAAAIAARRLRELGVHGIPRGPRPATRTNPAGLTDRELQIVPLLAAGWRNAEIAARLFLSPKTVEHHLGRIFAKLDVHARGDVAAAAVRLGVALGPGQDREPAPPK